MFYIPTKQISVLDISDPLILKCCIRPTPAIRHASRLNSKPPINPSAKPTISPLGILFDTTSAKFCLHNKKNSIKLYNLFC